MKNGLVELVFIIDESGSMGCLRTDTIGSYNQLLEDQKNEDGECIISTIMFNSKHRDLHYRKNIKDVNLLTKKDYKPRGNTALYDTLCDAIDRIGVSLSNTKEEERPSKVMFVIITDGLENASKEYSAKDVKDRIEHQKTKYSWDFNFIGSNIDVEKEAEKIGIDSLSAMTYTCDSMGTNTVYASLSNSISTLRSTGDYNKNVLNKDIQ